MQFAQHIENSEYLKDSLIAILARIQEAGRNLKAIASESNDSTASFYWQCQLDAANKQWDKRYLLNNAEVVVEAFNQRYKTTFKVIDVVEIKPGRDTDIWIVYMSDKTHGLVSESLLAEVAVCIK
jgi:hypothetical protein